MAKDFVLYSIFVFIYLEVMPLVSPGYFSSMYNYVKDNSVCQLTECCNENYIPFNLTRLELDLVQKLYGQPLVMNLVPILEAHRIQLVRRNADEQKLNKVHGKALAMSFHGWPGNGKNYVAEFIVRAVFKLGWESKFVKFYSARHNFPDDTQTVKYKTLLRDEVLSTIRKCDKSIFIFDEVEKMAPGILEAIKPMIDHYSLVDGTVVRNSIFIFLSNYAGQDISMRMLELYEAGYARSNIRMHHFEQVIRKAAYVDEGGFQNSAVVSGQLIDHYIPFLPMEAAHVKLCALAEFKYQGVVDPSDKMIEEAMSVVTYGPTKNAPIFANAGCKRMKRQVAYVIQAHRRTGRSSAGKQEL